MNVQAAVNSSVPLALSMFIICLSFTRLKFSILHFIFVVSWNISTYSFLYYWIGCHNYQSHIINMSLLIFYINFNFISLCSINYFEIHFLPRIQYKTQEKLFILICDQILLENFKFYIGEYFPNLLFFFKPMATSLLMLKAYSLIIELS